jgi:hypothetical protein
MNTHSLDLESSSSQYAERNDTASLSITGNFTIECWVKFESLPSSGNKMFFVNKWTTVSNQRSYQFGLENSGGTLRLFGGVSNDGTGESLFSSNWTPSTGIWYHVALVYITSGSSNVQFYVSGAAQGGAQDVADWSPFDSTARFVIGAQEGASYSGFYDGLIDDVRIWSTNRSSTEISNNKDKELVGNETNLVGYWKLNNNYTDSTANANDLSSVGSPVFSTDVPFSATYSQSFTDTITLSETFFKGTNRTIIESAITLSEVFLTSKIYFFIASDIITVSENFRKLRNGVSTAWTKLTKLTDSWTKSSKET